MDCVNTQSWENAGTLGIATVKWAWYGRGVLDTKGVTHKMNVPQIFDADETVELMVHYAVLRAALEIIANSPVLDEHVTMAQKALAKINE